LEAADERYSTIEEELRVERNDKIRLQQDWDVEKLAAQHELSNLKKKFIEQRAKWDSLEENNKSLTKSYSEILTTVESLGKDLDLERERNENLQTELTKMKLKNGKDSDVINQLMQLEIIISDLENEKHLLQVELEKLMKTRFSTERDEEYEKDVKALKAKVREYKALVDSHQLEREKWENEVFNLNGIGKLMLVEISNLNNERNGFSQTITQLTFTIEELNSKVGIKEPPTESGPSKLDLEEALMLLSLKREIGFNLEYLHKFNSNDKLVNKFLFRMANTFKSFDSNMLNACKILKKQKQC
jgi:chromosome segregation ATPase